MALTFTPEAEIGRTCPSFSLPSVEGKTFSLKDFEQYKVLVVMFICNHCPYVKAIEDRILSLANSFKGQSVGFVAICSNDSSEYPEDSFENIKKRWLEKQYPFPYLYDETQEVAKMFDAVCTPDFFVYNEKRSLSYRGRLDDSWKDATKVKSHELKKAIDELLFSNSISFEQHPSMGCSIKWKDAEA